MKNFKISKDKPIIAVWGIQDGCDRSKEGWSNFYPTHDHNFCILEKNTITKSIELERITRVKNDATMQSNIELILKDCPDNDYIAVVVNDYNGNSFISNNGIWRTECDKFELKDIISSAKTILNRKRVESYVVPHELAHIGSCLPFYGNFKENSLLVHIDGLASCSCVSIFLYKNKRIKLIDKGFFLLDTIQLFGFNDLTCEMMGGKNDLSRLSTPGKLMGYSAFGNYNKTIIEKLKRNNWYAKHWSNPKKFFNDFKFNKIDLHNQTFKDIGYSCQLEFENKLFEFFKKYQTITKAKNLYYSGGCALNINLNSKIINSGLFNNVFIPPCCSDSGLSIGAAALINFLRGNQIKKHSAFMHNINLKSEEQISKPLNTLLVDKIGKILIDNKTIGVCIGNAECGPRALGHRSILALPTKEMFDKVSLKLKQREWFRPVAPIILKENAQKVFKDFKYNPCSKYMLCSYFIKKEEKEKINGVCHIDNSSRPQIIISKDKETKHIYQILTHMWEKYKIPCLINTSFNRKGEPIVHTKKDAINSAKKMGLDYVLFLDELIDIKKSL